MSWDARQVRMLAEMGLRVWQPLPAARAEALACETPVEADPPRPATEPRSHLVRERVPEGGEPAAGDRPARAMPPSVGSPVEALDWPALRAAVAGCRACGLCESRTQTVFGVGHERAHWMVVGEAPGEQEDRAGEPFVGKAGQLLDQMLRAIGLGRVAAAAPAPGAAAPRGEGADDDAARQVYIANVLKCRPPMNRNPQPDEVARCEPFLRRQVALVQPRIILALGRFAVQSLLKTDEPIGRLRGRVHRYEGVPVIVSYHPAYLLRQPADKARAWDDLCLAVEVLAQRSPP